MTMDRLYKRQLNLINDSHSISVIILSKFLIIAIDYLLCERNISLNTFNNYITQV